VHPVHGSMNMPIVIKDEATNNKINISSCGAIQMLPDNIQRVDSFLSAAHTQSNNILFPNGITPT
jgi:hypothetical protein